ncbi:MAG: ATP-binding protein [Cyanobacteria bacterium P01_A01_bin.37]
MASIDQILRRAVNPFDPATFKPGNFWHEQQDPQLEVTSIHQDVLTEIEAILDHVGDDHRTRTLLLTGDSGVGKSYLLGRLKRILNSKAFFVYIEPFPDKDAIWRHVLRYTVDSLLHTPEGQADSQLLLWLKSLSVFTHWDVTQWVLTERQRFVRKLKSAYPSGIFNSTEFFGVLYDLLDPGRYLTACEWLRGDDLDDESLELIKVKQSINSEDAAQKTLANFGRIAAETQPIVLCFDQLDNIARTPDGLIDLQALYTVNSSIHNQGLKNFCIIISIITNTFRQNMSRVQPADQARIDHQISLRPIPIAQAESLWVSRLAPLHQQATPRPDSPMFPFASTTLEQKFPGGKAFPRNVLELGRRLLQSYKTGQTPAPSLSDDDVVDDNTQVHEHKKPTRLASTDSPEQPVKRKPSQNTPSDDAIAAFRLLWRKEQGQIHQRISRIRQLAAPELIQMMMEVLSIFGMKDARTRLLPSQTYASHSLSYQPPKVAGRVGIVWNEDANMTTFYHVMNACRRVAELRLCDTLYLIRGEEIGQPGRKGYQMHEQIFSGRPHRRIRPDLASVHDLATYHALVNATYAGELVIAGQVVSIKELEQLVAKSKVLQSCRLLHELVIVSGRSPQSHTKRLSKSQLKQELQPVREFLLDLVKTHQLLGYRVAAQTVAGQFPERSPDQIDLVITDLIKAKDIEILDPTAKPDEQLIYFAP